MKVHSKIILVIHRAILASGLAVGWKLTALLDSKSRVEAQHLIFNLRDWKLYRPMEHPYTPESFNMYFLLYTCPSCSTNTERVSLFYSNYSASETGLLHLARNRQGRIACNPPRYAAGHLPCNFPAGCGVGVLRTPLSRLTEIIYTLSRSQYTTPITIH